VKQGRNVPVRHLANAVHVFNRHETRELFHLAAFAYFTRLVKGQGVYAGARQQLLARYMSVTISQVESREDPNLSRAMVVCSRLGNELRQARGLSQKKLAEALDIQQPAIAKMEKRTDMYISTLRSHIEAMGGKLEVLVNFPEGTVKINNFSDLG
jgi:predicted XRE-type DNA-binding protein